MWLTFATAAVLIAYFGTTMAATLRRQQQVLATARERDLRNEQIIGMATLAAGTAHELSTPLTSIAVIASELEATTQGEARDDLRELVRQVNVCRGALQRLRDAADASRSDVGLRGEWAADHVRVHILDRGPGLAPAREGPRGMGVGLLLANATIERLGGQVRAADRPGGGTWLCIELPTHSAVAPA
jgi:signal transduction histidine kinase